MTPVGFMTRIHSFGINKLRDAIYRRSPIHVWWTRSPNARLAFRAAFRTLLP